MLRTAQKLGPLILLPDSGYRDREVNQVLASSTPTWASLNSLHLQVNRRHSSLEESEHADARQQKSLQQQLKPVSSKVRTQRLRVPPGEKCSG